MNNESFVPSFYPKAGWKKNTLNVTIQSLFCLHQQFFISLNLFPPCAQLRPRFAEVIPLSVKWSLKSAQVDRWRSVFLYSWTIGSFNVNIWGWNRHIHQNPQPTLSLKIIHNTFFFNPPHLARCVLFTAIHPAVDGDLWPANNYKYLFASACLKITVL